MAHPMQHYGERKRRSEPATVCTCTCHMCRLYGHRPELLHVDVCPEYTQKDKQ